MLSVTEGHPPRRKRAKFLLKKRPAAGGEAAFEAKIPAT